MIQWIGIALTIVGFAFNGYKHFHPAQVQPVQQVQQVRSTVQYSTVNIAYDHANGKHYFQHPDGQWRDFPPRP